MEEEIWKDIEGYEGYYQISSEGRVRSVDREIINRDKINKLKGKILNATVNCRNGYVSVMLCKECKKKRLSLHRLVAIAFVPNPNNYKEVNHKDEDKTNNSSSNLEWCDRKYNNNFGTMRERMTAKLSKKVYQYTLDGELVNIFPSSHECERNGFNRGAVAACCRGIKPKHKGYIWRYEPL